MAASISLVKELSVDGGMTFQPAPAPGPTIIPPTMPIYRYVVTNNGTVGLFDIDLTDDVLGQFDIAPFLSPGQTVTSGPVTGAFAVGENCNTATVTGRYSIIGRVSDSDTACYVGVLETCSIVAYQQVCLDADIAVDPSVTLGEVLLVCTAPPSVHPFGTTTCEPSQSSCGFTVQAMLCVAVPVSFAVAVDPVATRTVCQPASETSCLTRPL